jgi:ribosomal protein S18 acetylase RimI-like enzyme
MEVTTSPAVTSTTVSEAERVVAVLVLAFSTDPVARWSFSDPSQYLTHFPTLVRAFGAKAFTHGTGHHSTGFAGAALWLPPGVRADEEALGAAVQASVSPQRQPDVFGLFEQMAKYHPTAPHWYLPLIGVDPQHQGSGHGSALLRHALTECDREHAPAYLESTNPANIPLSERHGFEILATIQVGSSPPLFPMLRKTR